MAFSLPRSYSLRIIFVGYIRDKGYRETTRTMAELKTKTHQRIQTTDQETLKNIFKNMKTRLNFVVREQDRQSDCLIHQE